MYLEVGGLLGFFVGAGVALALGLGVALADGLGVAAPCTVVVVLRAKSNRRNTKI